MEREKMLRNETEKLDANNLRPVVDKYAWMEPEDIHHIAEGHIGELIYLTPMELMEYLADRYHMPPHWFGVEGLRA